MKPLHSFLRAGSAFLLALALTGCLGGSVDAAHQAAARRIGVISVLGDEAQGHLAGLPYLLFAGQSHGASADFSIDAAASAEAIQRLHNAYPASAVINLQTERGSVQLPRMWPELFFRGENFGHRQQALADAARQLATRHALNLVVMIVPWQGTNGGVGQAADEPGYGFRTVSLFGAHIGDVGVFANFAVAAYDGGTGQRLAFKIASVHSTVEDVKQRPSLDAYSPDERVKIAGELRKIVVEGTDEQLQHMHLTP